MSVLSNLQGAREFLKENINLSDVFELYGNDLTPAGVGRYKTHSVFNEEKTPSLFIDDNKKSFHDFSSGESGDIFDLVMHKEGISLAESVMFLAEKFNLSIEEYCRELSAEEQAINMLYSQVRTNIEERHTALLGNSKAIEYLKGRGVTGESISKYALGYCDFDGIPQCDNWEYLQYDRRDMFRDALLLPITDDQGRYLYWQSRPFNPMGGKYLFVRDSHPLYFEPRVFGFPQARKTKKRTGRDLVLVEGVFDAIALEQIDIPAIAVLGTHINGQLWELLKKYNIGRVILCFDGDSAGIKKTLKTCESFLNDKVTGIDLLACNVPKDGLDCEERINQHSWKEMEKIIDDAIYCEQYIIESKFVDCESSTHKIDFLKKVTPIMQGLDSIKKSICLERIASLMKMDSAQLSDIFDSQKKANEPLDSIESEEVILGKALRDWEFALSFRDEFVVDNWTLIRHKQLFKVIKQAEYVDQTSIYTMCNNLGYDSITEEYIDYLVNKKGKTSFAMRDFKDKILRRKAIKEAEELIFNLHNLETDSSVEVDKASSRIYSTMHEGAEEHIYEPTNLADSTLSALLKKRVTKSQLVGYSFGKGFPKLDGYTLGLEPSELVIVSASTSVGKTALCNNFCCDFAINQNIPLLYFSLEMSAEQMFTRNLAIVSGVDSRQMTTGQTDDDDVKKMIEANDKLRKAPFYISDTGHDIDEALSIARRYVQTKGVKIVVVDYIGLQTYSGGKRSDNRARELGSISKLWRKFALETGTVVILVAQLNRASSQKDFVSTEDIAESYELSQDCSMMLTLRNKTDKEMETEGLQNGNKLLNIAKNRRGEREVMINLLFEGGNYKFREV